MGKAVGFEQFKHFMGETSKIFLNVKNVMYFLMTQAVVGRRALLSYVLALFFSAIEKPNKVKYLLIVVRTIHNSCRLIGRLLSFVFLYELLRVSSFLPSKQQTQSVRGKN